MNAAGSSVILSGTFFYGGIVQLVAGFFALAAGATFAAAFLTAYGAFWLGYTAIQVYVVPHIVASVVGSGAQAGASALDAGFSLIRQCRADAGLGWLTVGPEALPAPLDAMSLGELEPDVWIPAPHAAAWRGTISLDELTRMDVIHGPRRAEPGTYDAWTGVLRTVDPRFEFTDPPLRHSLPMDLAFAAAADRPTAVLTGPSVITGSRPGLIRLPRPMVTHDMVRVGLEDHPLTATAALVWNGDLPRPLQQILFDAAGIAPPGPASVSSTDATFR